MKKEEQRFTAAVAAMQALCTSEIPEEVAMRAITIADALIKELDKDSVDTSIRYIAKVNSFITRDDDKHGYYNHYFLRLVDCPICAVPDIIGMTTKYCSQCGSKIEWVIEENEPLPPYEKDLFANSKNGDGKKITAIDLPYIESFPSQNSNSKTTPDPITEPSMITICGIKLRK